MKSPRLHLVLLLILIYPTLIFSQYKIDTLYQHLENIHFKGILNSKEPNSKFFAFNNGMSCFSDVQHYLWYKNKLVVQIDGSGKLFEIQPKSPVSRLDRTCYEGYSYGAFNFVFNDTIFSLGGYGFWQMNGMLRYYDEKTGEWIVCKTNKTVPVKQFICSNTYFDEADKKIYAIYTNIKPLYIEDSLKYDKTVYVQCLDLITKKWLDAPKILNAKEFDNNAWLIPPYFHTNKGLLIRYENEIVVLDFKHNEIKKIEPITKDIILNQLYVGKELLLFTKDSSLNFYNTITDSISSVVLKNNQLIGTGIPIYQEMKAAPLLQNKQVILLFLIIMGVVVFGYLIYRNKILKQQISQLNNGAELTSRVKSNQESIIQHPNSFKENLSETEKSLLLLLEKNTLTNTMTSVSQMNDALSLQKKPLKIQNNIRAATILLINKKFMVYSGCNDELIIKERTEFDKRFFEYAIYKKYLHKLK